MKKLNQFIESLTSWTTFTLTLLTFLIVILRYVFQLGWVWMQELTLYLHSIVFLVAASWALKNDAHVRIDIFYTKFSQKKKTIINACGVLLFLWPMCALIFTQTLPYVIDSWSVMESSSDSGGLAGVYLLKSLILVYCVLLFLQGGSILIESKKEFQRG